MLTPHPRVQERCPLLAENGYIVMCVGGLPNIVGYSIHYSCVFYTLGRQCLCSLLRISLWITVHTNVESQDCGIRSILVRKLAMKSGNLGGAYFTGIVVWCHNRYAPKDPRFWLQCIYIPCTSQPPSPRAQSPSTRDLSWVGTV